MHRRGFLAVIAAAVLFLPTSVPASDTHEIATGIFHDGDPVHRGSGGLSVTQASDGATQVRMIDMKIVQGPNLFVYLVKEPDPLFPEDVTADFVSLGKLQRLTGNQDYPVPENIDIRDWGSVVVWCDTFKTTFAIAPLAWAN